MARITVEDCVTVVPNRFELCLMASNRAKSIISGSPTTINSKEKPAVIALREIAEGIIDIEVQRKNVIKSMRNRGVIEVESSDEQINEAFTEEAESKEEFNDKTFIEEDVLIDD